MGVLALSFVTLTAMISDLEAVLLGYEQYHRELDINTAGLRELIASSPAVFKRRTSRSAMGRIGHQKG